MKYYDSIINRVENVDLEHPMQLLILFYNKRAESYKAKKCALSFQPFMG